jgi:putative ABC transport system substrate-binding protein
VKRREFMMLLGSAAAAGSVFRPLAARAEVSPKRPTVAWIAPGTRELGASFVESFLRGMREFGHVEGRSFDMVYRFGDGYQERLPALIEEVVRHWLLCARRERPHRCAAEQSDERAAL